MKSKLRVRFELAELIAFDINNRVALIRVILQGAFWSYDGCV
jgi:hypothetical protein